MLVKKISLALILNVCFLASLAQEVNPNEFISVKNFTPPSPEAAALGRYGEIPTDPSTGVPQISVPIYEIKSGKLSVSISLSYHASGIKLHDVATPVGLGWVLNAGGEISRNVIGKPDESATGLLNLGTNGQNTFRNKSTLINKRYNEDDYVYLDNLAKGYSDCQSDQFTYSAGNLSGKFLFDVDKTLHFTPIDRQPIITWNEDSSFTVTDDAGNIYYYNDKDYTTNESASGRYITSWHLSKIISADLGDSINFHYFTATSFADSTESHSYLISIPVSYDPEWHFCITPTEYQSYYTTNLGIYSHERKLIDSISFSNGYVKFAYSSDRQDIVPERLRKIKIGNKDGLIKETELVQSYFLSEFPLEGDSSESRRLRLDTVKFNDKNSQEINKYSFGYSSNGLPPYRYGEHLNNQTDYWGYYNVNGATGTWKLTLPAHYENQVYMFLHANFYAVSNTEMQEYRDRSSNKYANPDYMDACILQKINYPTGGYTLFEYEPNQITGSGDSTDYRGGLRVTKIISFDTVNRTPIIKSYTYDSVVSISPNIPRDFYYPTSNMGGISSYFLCYSSDFHINSNPAGPIGYFNGSPVINAVVTEYNGFPGLNNGKTVYRYDCEPDSVYSDPDTEKYWNFSTEKSWARGNLLNKKIYKVENDSSILIKETRNYYSSVGVQNIKVGEVCERPTKVFGSYTSDLSEFMTDTTHGMFPYDFRFLLNWFEYIDVVLPSGLKKLVKTEDIDYLDHDLTRTQELFYESPYHLYPTRTTSLTSKSADTLVTILRYPQDRTSVYVPYPASAALTDMVSYNILNEPFQTEQYRNDATGSHTISLNRTDYKNWHGSNRFYEEYRYSQGEPRIQFKEYDTAGNPTRLSQYNGTDIAYVWSYDHAYPTAQVMNANDSGIAYTSFETNDLGNWNIASSSRVTNASITGSKSFDLTSTYISKNDLPSGKYYLVTYWSNAGSATVNSGSGTSKKTKNGWTLYEHRLSNSTTSVTITGSVTIDELRLYPEDAQMTSYAYKPLVGIVSADNVNDIITYYEYDNAGRLQTIRDYDKNILKTIDYKYGEAQGTAVSGWATTGQGGTGGGIMGLLAEREEKDYNSSSPTYNQTRYVPIDLSYNTPDLVATGDTSCVQAWVNGELVNVGEIAKYIDQNPYSSRYHKTKWVSIAVTGSCPLPCDLPSKRVVSGVCETGLKVYTGSYYRWVTNDWDCIFHYEWSDTYYSVDYDEIHPESCELKEEE